jgi:hypothetical protein
MPPQMARGSTPDLDGVDPRIADELSRHVCSTAHRFGLSPPRAGPDTEVWLRGLRKRPRRGGVAFHFVRAFGGPDMSAVSKRFGRLRAVLETTRREKRVSRKALTILRNDPYRLDTPANHRDGAWVAEQAFDLGGQS